MTAELGTPPCLEIRLLGIFRVAVEGVSVDNRRWAGRKAQLLVRLLALEPHHRLHREQICDALWPELDLASATNQLYKAIHLARRALEPNLAPRTGSRFLVTEGSLVQLRAPGRLWIDAEVFEQQAAEAIRRKDIQLGEAAVALYGDDLLPEDFYEEWASARRDRLRLLHERLLAFLAEQHALARRYDRSIELLQCLVTRDPSNEDAHRSLMQLYAETGVPHQALEQYRECRAALHRELDAEPGRATQQLYARIASQCEGVASPPAARSGSAAAPPAPLGEQTVGSAERVCGGDTPDREPPCQAEGLVRAWRRVASGAAKQETALSPACLTSHQRRAGLLTPWCVSAALCALLLIVFSVANLPWSARFRYKVERVLEKAEMVLAAWDHDEPRLISIIGILNYPGARIEARNSASG